MSTKSTIYHLTNPDSSGFHFYRDYYDSSQVVHLQLDNIGDWQIDRTSCTVSIPIEVWELIRHYEAMSFHLVGKSDADLRTMARSQIAAGAEAYGRRLAGAKDGDELRRILEYSFLYEDEEDELVGTLRAARSRQERLRKKLDYLISENEIQYDQDRDKLCENIKRL